MKVVIATEGDSEVKVFPQILSSIRPAFDGPKPLRVICQPDGSPKHIAKASSAALKIAKSKRADKFVLVLDREENPRAPGAVAEDVKQEIDALGNWPFEIAVVIKDRTLENWLIADLEALRRQRARFDVSAALVKQIEPDKADRVRAIELLKKAAKGKGYDKKTDGFNISQRMDVDAAGRHSRSFRHFLHVLGHEVYSDQCRRPCPEQA